MNVNVIIKNAKTIAEYKEMKEKMKQLTEKCYDKHKKEFKDWKDGELLKAWIDSTEAEERNILYSYMALGGFLWSSLDRKSVV